MVAKHPDRRSVQPQRQKAGNAEPAEYAADWDRESSEKIVSDAVEALQRDLDRAIQTN